MNLKEKWVYSVFQLTSLFVHRWHGLETIGQTRALCYFVWIQLITTTLTQGERKPTRKKLGLKLGPIAEQRAWVFGRGSIL